jgi:hypothetical protein
MLGPKPRRAVGSAKDSAADRNFKGPFYTLGHVRYRLKRDTGVLERGLGSVGALEPGDTQEGGKSARVARSVRIQNPGIPLR